MGGVWSSRSVTSAAAAGDGMLGRGEFLFPARRWCTHAHTHTHAACAEAPQQWVERLFEECDGVFFFRGAHTRVFVRLPAQPSSSPAPPPARAPPRAHLTHSRRLPHRRSGLPTSGGPCCADAPAASALPPSPPCRSRSPTPRTRPFLPAAAEERPSSLFNSLPSGRRGGGSVPCRLPRTPACFKNAVPKRLPGRRLQGHQAQAGRHPG